MITPRLVIRLAAAAVAALLSTAPLAQAPAPAAEMPKPKCDVPGDYPSKLSSEMQRRLWAKSRDAYLECLKKYIAEQKDLSETHLKAGNAAVAEYNAAIKRFNEQMEAPQ
jgi:hypothetical protein